MTLKEALAQLKSLGDEKTRALQWTMNSCLAGIGIHFPNLRKRAVAIGGSRQKVKNLASSRNRCYLPT